MSESDVSNSTGNQELAARMATENVVIGIDIKNIVPSGDIHLKPTQIETIKNEEPKPITLKNEGTEEKSKDQENVRKSKDLFEQAEEMKRSSESLKKREPFNKQAVFGISKEVSYVINNDSKKLLVTNLETREEKSFTAFSTKCIMLEEKNPLFATSKGFVLCNWETEETNEIPYEYVNPKQMVIDPICSERFFFLTAQKKLFCIQHDTKKGTFENNLFKENVNWFDVSGKYFLLRINETIQLWKRQDTALEPIWSDSASSSAKFFIDDNFLYELKDKIVTTRDVTSKSVCTTTPNVWTLWKGASVVIELEEGVKVNETSYAVDNGIITCADANKKHIVLYNNLFEPDIRPRDYYCDCDDDHEDTALIEAKQEMSKKTSDLFQTVCGSIKEQKDALIKSIREVREPVLKQIQRIGKLATETSQDLEEVTAYLSKSGCSVKSLVTMLDKGENDPNQIILKAMNRSKEDFRKFCIDANIKERTSMFSEDTLIKVSYEMLQLLEDDPINFAEILCNTVLEIDTFNSPEAKKRLVQFGNDLSAVTVGLYQRLPAKSACQKYIRILMNIGISLGHN